MAGWKPVQESGPRGMEAMERVAKMQGTNVPFLTVTNVPTGTKLPFSTFVPVKNCLKNI
jgi:hypothetical protein